MKHKPSRVVVIEWKKFESAAWRKLNATAINVFLQFRKRCQVEKVSRKQRSRQEWTIKNNGEIILTFAEGQRLLDISMTAL